MSQPVIHSTQSWEKFHLDSAAQQQMLDWMPAVVGNARWYGGKSRTLEKVAFDHCLPLTYKGETFYLFILTAFYKDYEPDYYLLPVAKSSMVPSGAPGYLFQWKDATGEAGLIDASFSSQFQECLFNLIRNGESIKTNSGIFKFERGPGLPASENYLSSVNPKVEQSNSSILYNDRYFLKIYRKLFREANPESEMLKFLTEEGHYSHVPAYAGSLSWERENIPTVSLALLMTKVNAPKDNWESTGDELNNFLSSFLNNSFSINEYVFEQVELLARRTAEMHLALAQKGTAKEFVPEPYDEKYRSWLFDHLQHLLTGRIEMLERNQNRLDDEATQMGQLLRNKQELISKFFNQIKTKSLKSLRTRIHGDYHLGQVLYTNSDFVIIDFEGEPESSIIERKIKHSPMKDVAGMIRSFHYAVSSKLYFSAETRSLNRQKLQRASDRWFYLIRDTFLEKYFATIGKDNPVYFNKSETNFLLHLHLMEKAIYELGYELNGRPDWVKIPLKGIEEVINELEKYLE